jgi:hypothetical protein
MNFGIPLRGNNFINQTDDLNIIRNQIIAKFLFIRMLKFVVLIIQIIFLKTIFKFWK